MVLLFKDFCKDIKNEGFLQAAKYRFHYAIEYQSSITWRQLKVVLASKAVSNAAPWLVITPIAANLLRETPETAKIGPFELTLALPFSWIAMFFCALSFLIARLIYLSKCPNIIKDYRNYTDVSEKGVTPRELLNIIYFDCNRSRGSADPIYVSGLIELVAAEDYDEALERNASVAERMRRKGAWLNLHQLDTYFYQTPGTFPLTDARLISHAQDLYWHAVNILEDEHNRFWRSVATIFTLIGILCLIVILSQSIFFVVSELIS